MSAYPEGRVTDITEEIMAAIKPHLQADELGQAHHYNRTYEKVWNILNRVSKTGKKENS